MQCKQSMKLILGTALSSSILLAGSQPASAGGFKQGVKDQWNYQFSENRHATSDLTTELTLGKVKVAVANRHALLRDRVAYCDDGNGFHGTFAGNDLILHAEPRGGTGKYRHTLVYRFDEGSYVPSDKRHDNPDKYQVSSRFRVHLPELKPDVQEVLQEITLITEDSDGNTARNTMKFMVSRPVILTPSGDETAMKHNCTEIQGVYPSPLGRETNGSTTTSHIEIQYGVQKSVTHLRGWNAGVYVSPTVGYAGVLVNLAGVSMNYFSQMAKNRSESVQFNHSYDLAPGDYLDVYIQPTRRVTAYDAQTVDSCGNRSEVHKGAYLLQTWSFAYPVAQYNPASTREVLPSTIGAPLSNTCHEDLDPITAQKPQHGKYQLQQFYGGQE